MSKEEIEETEVNYPNIDEEMFDWTIEEFKRLVEQKGKVTDMLVLDKSSTFPTLQPITLIELLTGYEETMTKEYWEVISVSESKESKEVNQSQLNSWEQEEIEVVLQFNKVTESNEDLEPDHGCSEIEDACVDLTNLKDDEEIEIKDNTSENVSNQTRDEYLSEEAFEKNDMINFNSPTTYNEHHKEIKSNDIKIFEVHWIFYESINGNYYENEMIFDHSPPTFDIYSQESNCDDNLNQLSIFNDLPLEQ